MIYFTKCADLSDLLLILRLFPGAEKRKTVFFLCVQITEPFPCVGNIKPMHYFMYPIFNSGLRTCLPKNSPSSVRIVSLGIKATKEYAMIAPKD